MREELTLHPYLYEIKTKPKKKKTYTMFTCTVQTGLPQYALVYDVGNYSGRLELSRYNWVLSPFGMYRCHLQYS